MDKPVSLRMENYVCMEIVETKRKCPVCGEPVIGRADKKYCSDECRTFSWNLKCRERRIAGKDREVGKIEKDLMEMQADNCRTAIKIIALVTRFCKILYKFGT